jgi:diguanylate cyclase (GGDEF)-like protein
MFRRVIMQMAAPGNGQRRITVGLLLDSHLYLGMYPSKFYSTMIRGIQAAARDQGVNLLIACGVRNATDVNRLRPAWPELIGNVDFVPVGPWNTDGLLVVTPLREQARIRYIQQLQEKQFPVLFIGGGCGSPTIMVDNEGGIRQILEHLAGHGHREIAFIAGDPQDPGDSLLRVEAYRKGVQDLSLSSDPRLLEYGFHADELAYSSMKRMLQSGVKFTAVACSNDQSALGVIQALDEAGLRIPWDVAVTGFDDQPEALVQIPPLTSAHYPIFETGYRALVLIRKRLVNGPGAVPDLVRVSTRLMVRQSCGCFPENVSVAALERIGSSSAVRSHDAAWKEIVVREMMDALRGETAQSDASESRWLCDEIAGGFLKSLGDGDNSHFRITLLQILQQIERSDFDTHSWQSAISVLRLGLQGLRGGVSDPLWRERGEDLLHQARTLLSESASRRYIRLQLLQTRRNEALGRLSSRLLSSLDEDQIYNTLTECLPQVGVRSCRVAFIEKRDDDPIAVSRVYLNGKDMPATRFESREFPPPGLYPPEKPLNLALLPLFFQEENLGYVAFDGENLEPLAIVALQLASAIKSAQLHKKVLELSLTDDLTEVHNRRYFEMLLEQEVDRGRRYGRDLAVIMIDIDRFKEYNDTFGHLAGDKALREVAGEIQAGARRGLDIVTRYGGEEFAIILPETDKPGAWVVAEKIRRTIGKNRRFLRHLTVSLGIASLIGDSLDSRTLVEQADRALYQAKKRGRNRSVQFEDGMMGPPIPSNDFNLGTRTDR